MNRPRVLRQIVVVLAFCAVATTSVSAQTPPADAARGRQIAERVCVGCHALEPGAQVQQADIPSFPVIANRPGRTADYIIGAMYSPHPPMPGVSLTSQEMRDLAAYILTFKKGQ